MPLKTYSPLTSNGRAALFAGVALLVANQTYLRSAHADPGMGTPLASSLRTEAAGVFSATSGRPITLEDVTNPNSELNQFGRMPYITQWQRDGVHYLQYADDGTGESQLMSVDARTGKMRPFYDAAKMEAALTKVLGPGSESDAQELSYRSRYKLDDAETETLLTYKNDLYMYRFAAGIAVRLTQSPQERKENVSISPDGQHVAYVRGRNNLFVADYEKPGIERQLTHDGPKFLNGHLDWIYEEELYGRGDSDGYVWSPDSSSLLFLHLDENPVKPFGIMDNLPVSQSLEPELYPKPGDPNPIVSLGIASIHGNSEPRFVDLSKYPDADRLIVRISWSPDSKRAIYQVQNRIQTFLDLNSVDAATGKEPKTLIRETTKAWVDVIEPPLWLKDGTFLWQSDHSGHRHLFRYKADGTLIHQLTDGDWDIRTVFGADPKGQWVYFSSSQQSPIAHHVYRVAVNASPNDPPVEKPQHLTLRDGDHQARFDPTYHLFLDEHSGITSPRQLDLISAETGETVRVESEGNANARRQPTYKISVPEFMTVKTRDGFSMQAMLIKPANFDPTKKYPVFCPVYSGPGIQTVTDRWGAGQSGLDQSLAQKGYIIWECDNRSASGQGAASMWPIYRKFGESELSDIEDGLNYLKQQPWVDATRIGISGWSFGGFMAEYALTHSKTFKIGISGAGVADWRLYDSIYTERYMDTPEANPTGYKDTSPINAAALCSGKLLLIHGMMDDNVHLQNTVGLVYGLEKAGKDFEMMFYPGANSRHDIADPQLNRHLQTLTYNFILNNL